MNEIIGRTKAKINLCLQIEGKMQNGYHKLHSIVAFCNIGDVLQINPAQQISLQLTGEFAQNLNGENIIMQAVRALLPHANCQHLGADIILHKNLPLASGIGGGSGDCALALQMLNQLWNCELSQAQLAEIGLAIGADVPVCLHGKLCQMSGIGEHIQSIPFEIQPLYIVLINPLVQIPTANIFAQLTASQHSGRINFADNLITTLQNSRNDLEFTAINICPEIAEIINFLTAQDESQIARMSGSGATCFAICANQNAAQSLLKKAQAQFPLHWVAHGAIS